MNDPDAGHTDLNPAADAMTTTSEEPPIEADELVEEVSIDGMCGVY
ncbi:mycofactocin precursor MftA [Streptomyces sp. NPDC005373]